jgi:hypothetical protein
MKCDASGQICYAVGSGGVVIATTNAGDSWRTITLSPTDDLYGVDISRDGQSVWIAGANGFAYHSPDGGRTWPYKRQLVNDRLRAIAFYPGQSKGLAVGDRQILRTADSGETWPIVYQDHNTLTYVAVSNDMRSAVCTVSGGDILRSIDGGRTWFRVQVPDAPNRSLWKVSFDETGRTAWAFGTAIGLRLKECGLTYPSILGLDSIGVSAPTRAYLRWERGTNFAPAETIKCALFYEPVSPKSVIEELLDSTSGPPQTNGTFVLRAPVERLGLAPGSHLSLVATLTAPGFVSEEQFNDVRLPGGGLNPACGVVDGNHRCSTGHVVSNDPRPILASASFVAAPARMGF